MRVIEKHNSLFMFILSFSYFFGFYSVVSMLPLILSEKIVMSLFLVVIMYSSRYLANFIYSGFFLNLAKKINVKLSLLFGISSLIASFLIIFNFRYVPVIIFAFGMIGFASGLSELKLVNTSQKYGQTGVSSYYTGFFLGLFLSILSSGFILNKFGLIYLIFTSTFFFMISFVFAIFIDTEKNNINLNYLIRTNIVKDNIDALKYLKNKMFYIFFVKMICEGFNSLKDLFIPLILVEVFMKSKVEVSVFLAMILIPAIMVQKYLDKILKYIPPVFFLGGHKRRVMSLALFLLFISSIMISFTSNLYALLALLFIAVFSYSIITPTLNLVLISHYSDEIAEESSLLQISSSLGKLFLTIISLLIIVFFKKMQYVFLIPAVLFLVLLLYLIIDTIKEGKTEKIESILKNYIK